MAPDPACREVLGHQTSALLKLVQNILSTLFLILPGRQASMKVLSEVDYSLISAVCTAIGAWAIVFHRQSMRGDYVVLFHSAAIATLYIVLRASTTFSATAFNATAKTSVAYLVTLLLVTFAYRLSPWHPLAAYPGPLVAKLSSLWLTYISCMGRRDLVIDALHVRYGPFLRIGPHHISINSASAASSYVNAEKSDAYRYPGHGGGVGLFFKQDDPEAHRARKRLWKPLFTPAGMQSLVPQLERRTVELLMCMERRQLESKTGYVDLAETMYHWAHDFMGDMAFGGCNQFRLMENGDPGNVITLGKITLAMIDCLGHTPWLMDILWHIPVTRWMRVYEAEAQEMVRARVQAQDLPNFRDLASYWIEAGLNLKDMDSDAVVVILGGSDNSSIIVTLSLFFLLTNVECYHRLRRELVAAFPDPTNPFSASSLADLPFLDGVLNETLRLTGHYFNPRIVPPGGVVIDGKHIPEGMIFALANHSQQISPENFSPNPEAFLPERWLPAGLGPHAKLNRAMLGSFSYGPHYCIGRPFAYVQMRMALARLMLAFDFELPKAFDPTAFRRGILNYRTMFLETPLEVSVTRRPGVNLEAMMGAVAE